MYQLINCIYDTPPDVIDKMMSQPYEMFFVYAPEQLEVQENSCSRCCWTHAIRKQKCSVDIAHASKRKALGDPGGTCHMQTQPNVRDPILYFGHTNFIKHTHVGSCQPRTRWASPIYGKSWICHWKACHIMVHHDGWYGWLHIQEHCEQCPDTSWNISIPGYVNS